MSTPTGAHILVIDDDPAILLAVRRDLEGRGYRVLAVESAAGLADHVAAFRPDVILLDLVLPDGDGIAVCRSLRASGVATPIIVLSALGDDAKKVQALDEGADDYLTKPFSMPELEARIRVALRRQAGLATGAVLTAGGVVLDLATRDVRVNGRAVHLTPREFGLLKLLMEQRGRVLTQRHILQTVWGPEYADDGHILRTFVHQLRGKLGEAGSAIVTDPGVGYRLVADES
ncbi:MAG: response regulator transcription factor [Tepidiformaceae bacterium]